MKKVLAQENTIKNKTVQARVGGRGARVGDEAEEEGSAIYDVLGGVAGAVAG